MKQESSLWAPSPQAGSEDVLRLLDESHRLLSAILLGIIMQMRSLELERCRLLGARVQGVEQLQLSASLLSVWALMGFNRQAGELSDPCDQTLGSASLTIGLIRLMKLLAPEQTLQEEVAEFAEPDGLG